MLTISVTVNHHHHLKTTQKLETLVFLEPQDAPDLFPGHHARGQLRASSRRRPAAKKEAGPCEDSGLPHCEQAVATWPLESFSSRQSVFPEAMQMAAWSSGMILASGARGPGLNSWSSPLALGEKGQRSC